MLGESGINIEMISTSPIKISCVIAADRVPDAVRALHEAFELGADAIREEDPTGSTTARGSPGAVSGYRVGVLGATGAVGSTVLEVLAERCFPVARAGPARLRALGRQAVAVRRRRGRVPAARPTSRSPGSTS